MLINFFIFSLDNLYFLIYNMFCCEAVMFYKDVRLAQLDRAFGYGPKGRGFESSSARVKRKGDAKSISLFFSEATRKIRPRVCISASLRSAQSQGPLDLVRSPLRSGRRKAKVHLYRARFKSELTRTGSLPIDFDYCRDFYAIKGAYYAIRTKTCYRIFSPNMIK